MPRAEERRHSICRRFQDGVKSRRVESPAHEGSVRESVELAEHAHPIDKDDFGLSRLRGSESREMNSGVGRPAFDRGKVRFGRFMRGDDQSRIAAPGTQVLPRRK